MQNKLSRSLVEALFYLTFIVFVLVHIGVAASILMHLFSGQWLEAMSYLFIYPAICWVMVVSSSWLRFGAIH